MSKERLVRGSGSSCPLLVTKRKASKTTLRGFYSSTNLLSSKKMKRLISRGGRGTPKIKAPEGRRNSRRVPDNKNGVEPLRDIFDFIPKRCVQVRGVRRSDEPPGNSSTRKRLNSPAAPQAAAKAHKPRRSSDSVSSLGSSEEKGSRTIDVIVRIRPKNRQEDGSKTVLWKTTSKDLLFDPKEKSGEFYFKGKKQCVRCDFGKGRRNKNLTFAFDYVYGPESTNEEMFNTSLKKLIDQVLDGYNCTVFAYGSTGSGKTYTMLGSSETPGICVLMAEELYRRLDGLRETHLTDVSVSYLEVYNETIKDLLKPDKELYIREDGKKGIIIPDLTSHTPRGPEDLLRLLKTGNNARSQHATDLNSESSRSHAVFQIAVMLRQRSEVKSFKMRSSTSRLFMVDLAGSEKGITSSVDGIRQREGANINKSLLALSNCINALADGKSHIPYRNSKLTRLLKDSLSGNCVTVMIANVSPSELHFEDTHNTLHYANRAKNIKITCKQNYFSEELLDGESTQIQISELHDQIRLLTRQLEVEREGQQQQVKDHHGRGDNAGEPAIQHHHPSSSLDYLEKGLERKGELVGDFVDACVAARLHEWEMNWKKLKVDVADFVGKLDVSDPHFITLAKLKNAQSNLAGEYPEMVVVAEGRKEDLETHNEEMGRWIDKYLGKVGSSLRSVEELLAQKQVEMDLIASEKLREFHEVMNGKLVEELVEKEVHSVHLIRLLQSMASSMSDEGLLSSEHKESFKSVISPLYGGAFSLQPPAQVTRAKYSIKEDLTNLEKTISRPVVQLPDSESCLGGRRTEGRVVAQESSSVGFSNSWVSRECGNTSNKDTVTCEESSEDEVNVEINKDHLEDEDCLVGASVTSSETSITEDSCETSSSATTSSSEEAVNVKKRKPVGNATCRVSPGSSYLSRTQGMESGRPSQLVLRSGRAFTNLTKVDKPGRSGGSYPKEGIGCVGKPPIIPPSPPPVVTCCSSPGHLQDKFILPVNKTPSTFSFSEMSCTSNSL